MSIQPLRRKARIKHLHLGDKALAQHPEIALSAFRTVAVWSIIDEHLASIAAHCLSADFGIVAAMFEKITSAEAKRAAVHAIVKEAIGDTPDWELFSAIDTLVGPARKTRHKFAHWLWGISPEVPNRLILANPASVKRHSAIRNEMRARAQSGEDVSNLWPPVIPKEGIYVLSKTGARACLKEGHRCEFWLAHFTMLVGAMRSDPEKAEKQRILLRGEGLIQAFLSPPPIPSSP